MGSRLIHSITLSFKPDYYDLVILDIKMLGMNGFELNAELHNIDVRLMILQPHGSMSSIVTVPGLPTLVQQLPFSRPLLTHRAKQSDAV